MSFNPQAGPKGVVSGIENISAGLSPIFGDFNQFVTGNPTLLIAAGLGGVIISFMMGKKKGGPLHEVLFIGSAAVGALGLYGYTLNKKDNKAVGYAHSYYAPGEPQGPYYQPYMYNQPPPPYPIYGAPPYIQGPPNIHYVYGGYYPPPEHHNPSIFELIFGKNKHKKKKNHHHPFYPLYTQPLNSFNAYDTEDVIVPRQIVTGKAINGARNPIDDSNHVFSNISDMY